MRLHMFMLKSHTGWERRGAGQSRGLSDLTADIWLRAECGNTISDRANGQPNQLGNAREWFRVAL